MRKFMFDLENQIPRNKIKYNEPLRNHTFIRLGGEADILVQPTTNEEIQTVIDIARRNNVPLTILGKGSNTIIKDKGIRGITLSLSHFNQIEVKGCEIKAQSGADIIAVSRAALDHTLTGLEFACGIPGSVGGALYMNAGAYGGQVSDVLQSAHVLTRGGELLNLSGEEMELGYRKSIFRSDRYIILDAVFRLEEGDQASISAKMNELTLARESKQPLEYPSCGSVFKRPEGHFAGKLIQDCQLQGTRIGGAEVSTKHAGFIVNVDNATAQDYLDLIEHIQQKVREKFDVELETEVITLGE
ncbi:UDP-N-acetylenolpyruvoylglucosamine reductase 2 [Paenibacillus physcomitrellae]|uniref:UDP-N-acetylenolpyruvoylglucosamine reductase n=2 Tax=Paenibacillus physcomitrellae TaxID=1619311 RepID=A0ABQ1FT06_9BACL|nr:UDP-N-acetylmuramate dehydrogenase [Paenibacillus physcomitrellae]GGA29824.1 UDP-N-acetylenolpyruvoylglucosamine reductase 2 [Paenibacillus physcomitrellae]